MKKLISMLVIVMASMVFCKITEAQSIDLGALEESYRVDTPKVEIYSQYNNSPVRETRRYYDVKIYSAHTQIYFPDVSGKIIFELSQPIDLDEVQIKEVEEKLTSLFRKEKVKFKKIKLLRANGLVGSLVLIY